MRATLILFLAAPTFAADCPSLATLSLPATTITKAEAVAAGAFTLPNQNPAQPSPYRQLPAFCRVAATIRPTSDSEIKIEVWMPADGWNGKFMGVGNGGWSGNIVYPALSTAVSRGYAAASTNTGHDGGDASFAPGHPEKLVDFAYRAVHEMTVKAKALTEAYYGKAPQRSYWNGCSSGGKQGLKEAQKFPARLRRHHRRRARELLDSSDGRRPLARRRHTQGPRRRAPAGQTRRSCTKPRSRPATSSMASKTACSKIPRAAASTPPPSSARAARRTTA